MSNEESNSDKIIKNYSSSEMGAFLHGYMYRMSEELDQDTSVFNDMNREDLFKMIVGVAEDVIKESITK